MFIIQDLQELSASPRVVDITHRKPGTIPVLDKALPMHQLVERTSRLISLQQTLAEVSRLEFTSHLDIKYTLLLSPGMLFYPLK